MNLLLLFLFHHSDGCFVAGQMECERRYYRRARPAI